MNSNKFWHLTSLALAACAIAASHRVVRVREPARVAVEAR
jgi:hypothetical protein